MNLRTLRPSRRPPRPGDVFALGLPDGTFLFGRVIRTDANPLGVGRGVLIYVYHSRTSTRDAVPELSPDSLLIPPLITNRLPWSRGYFEFVEHRPLTPRDQLPAHSFRNSQGLCFDEFGRRIPDAIGAVGEWGLHSYRSIDDAISKAIGIPLSAE
ncbi:MAG: immunity 26/phosphotriesterase HocA family protein [Planctomycetes bacterium]|nr:immunity 26/phosphotriesterase HocA family protein [Planctomycetota bacterium]